ncbi:MAG: hypothetical protein K1X47_03670 [Cyclobacteriaceae bacterium]|nr:hypothetical protein [Cyclobacteriaceae bacterium]
MVEVFRTNVENHEQAALLRIALIQKHPAWSVHFDLEDCDKVLRIQATDPCIPSEEVEDTLQRQGFQCELLL